MTRAVTCAVACLLALVACGQGDTGRAVADQPATTRAAPAPATADPAAAWCDDYMAAYAATDMPGILAAAESASDLSDPAIALPAADVVESLTWAGGSTPPPASQLSDALLALGFSCDPF